MNITCLTGRIGHDLELTYARSGTAMLRFRLATNDFFAKEKVTNWHTCKMFGKPAEIVAENCGKGSQLSVSGQLFEDNWEDRDGNKRRDVVVMVRDFTLAPGGESRPQPRRHEPEPNRDQGLDPDDDIPF